MSKTSMAAIFGAVGLLAMLPAGAQAADAAAGVGAAPLSAAAAAEAAARGRLKALKARLPEAVSFTAIRLVIAHRERQAASNAARVNL